MGEEKKKKNTFVWMGSPGWSHMWVENMAAFGVWFILLQKKFTFSFIKRTRVHYVQFEEYTANILVSLFKIEFCEH